MGTVSNRLKERPVAFRKIKGQVSYVEFALTYCMLFLHGDRTEDVFASVGIGRSVVDSIYTEIIAGKKAEDDARRLYLLPESEKEVVTERLGSLQ